MSAITRESKINPWEALTLTVAKSQEETKVEFEKAQESFQEFERVSKVAILELRRINLQLRESIATLKAQKGDLKTAHSAKTAALDERIKKLREQQETINAEHARLKAEIAGVQNDSSAIQARVNHLQSPAGQQEAVNQMRSELARMGF